MKVALVHDYLNEFGGAERVLLSLSEMYPDAPIYTAFYKEGSAAYERFKDKKIIPSFAQKIPGFVTKLHSPLRFLAPLIWESFNLDEFDVVITSSGWYITKGVLTRPETLHISYIHTPPRYLYGYSTALEWQKYWPIRVYAALVNKGLREYDFVTAQRVDILVANSKEVQKRIEKFWRRESVVIYPPVEISEMRNAKNEKRDYYLTGGRLVGPKHFDLAIKAANELKLPLKVYGDGPLKDELTSMAGETVEMLGHVTEQELEELYAGAKGFIALAEDEDFGITPVEAMAAGTPVLAYRGGGYLETVTDPSTSSGQGATGVFVDDLSVAGVKEGIKKLQDTRFEVRDLIEQAKKFGKERFKKEIRELIDASYAKASER